MGLLASLLGFPSSNGGLGARLGEGIKKSRRKKRWGEEDYLKMYNPEKFEELMKKKKKAAFNIRKTQTPLGGAEEGLPYRYTSEYYGLKPKKSWEE